VLGICKQGVSPDSQSSKFGLSLEGYMCQMENAKGLEARQSLGVMGRKPQECRECEASYIV
jgi:hypothetical protein